MDIELFLLFTFIVIAVYVLGILTHKYAINQADAVKTHVTDEVSDVRADFADHIADVRKDLAELLAKVETKV